MSQAGILSVTESSPQIPTIFQTDAGIAVPSANTLNIFGGSGITTSGSGNTVTISAGGFGVTWNIVTSANNPVSLVANNGYIAKGAGVVNFVLPATATVGNAFVIVGYGNLWTLAQNAMQFVTLGIQTSTVGVTGGLSATVVSDKVELLCVTANFEFTVLQPIGNITVT